MAQPNERDEISYSLEAIEVLDAKWESFYDVWLELAEQHAEREGRNIVNPNDINAVLSTAVKHLLNEDSGVASD